MSPAANIDRDCLRCFRPMRGSHQKVADKPPCGPTSDHVLRLALCWWLIVPVDAVGREVTI